MAATVSGTLEKDKLSSIRDQLEVSDLYFIPLDAPLVQSIPKSLQTSAIYKTKEGKKVMTAYAPIFDEKGHIMGMMGSDIDVGLIDQKFKESLFLIILCAGVTILLVVVTLFFIANKISRPVAKLNNSALAIAAGQYGESVKVRGPKEIAELANTLSTMSECLYDNINRLKENSYLRERMYGEYESSLLLQHMMLQKNIDECKSDALAIQSITFFSENPRGFLLDFPTPSAPHLFEIHILEAAKEGFEGMYQLLTHYKMSKKGLVETAIETLLQNDTIALSLTVDTTTSHLHCQGSYIPIFWSSQQKRFLSLSKAPVSIQSGDYFFAYNSGLRRFFQGEKRLGELLSKVLNVFAGDGLETTSAMLRKEISFLTKKESLTDDLHLLCFQILQ